jgi:hypothetical protein
MGTKRACSLGLLLAMGFVTGTSAHDVDGGLPPGTPTSVSANPTPGGPLGVALPGYLQTGGQPFYAPTLTTSPEPVVSAPIGSSTPVPARTIWGPGPATVPRFWFRTEYLLWWNKTGPLSEPLVTLGSPSDAIPGALGQPGTQVIYGGDGINFRTLSGMRFETGLWLNADQTVALESGLFTVGGRAARFSAFSDGFGNPVVARPIFNAQLGIEDSYLDSVPGTLSGGAIVTSLSQLFSWDINTAVNFTATDQFRWDGLIGFRYLNLFESLRIEDQLFPLANNALTFLGQPVDPSSSVTDVDRFRTSNNFYGGQLGTRLTWMFDRWVIGATAKVAMGDSQETAVIRGSTAMFAPNGAVTWIPGGILATTANIGNYHRNAFAVVPETGINLGYHITPRITARVGYTFVYWSNVLRPGNQLSRVVSPNLVPTDPNFGAAGPNSPSYQFHASSYWAQGLNFGLDFNF